MSVGTPEIEQQIEGPHEPTEEELLLVSSDLDDCPEVWQGELGSYVLETHKRLRQVEAFFSSWTIVSGIAFIPVHSSDHDA